MTEAGPSVSLAFILPVDERYGPARGGAIATCVREMTRALLSRGVVVQVIAPRSSDASYAQGIVTTLQRSGDPRSTWARLVRGAMARVRPGVWGARERYVRDVCTALGDSRPAYAVVSNDPALATEIAGRGPGVLLWLHNYLRGAEAALLSALPADVRIVAVSESVRRWTIDAGGLDEERVVTIYNGVDHDMFHPVARTTHRAPSVRVVIPGRIDPNKGQLLALRAVGEVLGRGVTGIEVTVMGAVQTFGHDDEAVSAYEGELADAARQAGATMMGRVPADRVADVLRSSDIALVLPLVPEPFGLAALEAMACGCATIAVAAGGLAEVVGDAAIIVEPAVDLVAGELQRLIEDRDRLVAMSHRAVTRSQEFGWARSADRLRELTREGPDR